MLLFEGEYNQDKKWNGFGKDGNGKYFNYLKNGSGFIKEYDEHGILRFEGEYLNGKRNGKGKEYDYNGYIKFEGEYLNGKRNGIGNELSSFGNIKSEAEYLNGKLIKIIY